MSQCPLGFTGTPPPGHPKVAGLDAKASEADTRDRHWNPWLLLAIDALFILAAIYVARNGVPRAIADPIANVWRKVPKPAAKTE